MQEKPDISFVTQQNSTKYCSYSSWKSLLILIVVVSSLQDCESAVWSITAMERLKAKELAKSTNPQQVAQEFQYKVAVFYGTHKERLQNRECEKLKCEFISTGCLVTDLDPPPPFLCFTIWSEMSQPKVGLCPYKPCESYNQESKCLPDEKSCTAGRGEPVPFGLCKNYGRCCLFPGTS